MRLTGKRAVIMGGTSGIGEATAASFAAAGATVVITGRDEQRLRAALGRLPDRCTGRRCDATRPEDLAEFFASCQDIDHLVLALSGAAGGGPFATLDLANLAAGFDAKFWAHVRALQAALPHMRDDGSVTFVTAASARAAIAGTAGLAAINGALEAMVRPLAVELAPLRVNAVSPGVIDTPWWTRVPQRQRDAMFHDLAASLPVGRVGRSEDVAAAVVHVAVNGFTTGTVLECDGGAHLAR